jgi:uncharacterized protein (DUF302 family)
MNKSVSFFIMGFFGGASLILMSVFLLMPRLMLVEESSPHTVQETVSLLTNAVVQHGWVVSTVVPLDESIRKNGGVIDTSVRLVNICQAQHASALLKDDDLLPLSVMMPCTISVYEKKDGTTYVAFMNAALMGRIFGGEVARVMGGDVATEQRAIITMAIGE